MTEATRGLEAVLLVRRREEDAAEELLREAKSREERCAQALLTQRDATATAQLRLQEARKVRPPGGANVQFLLEQRGWITRLEEARREQEAALARRRDEFAEAVRGAEAATQEHAVRRGAREAVEKRIASVLAELRRKAEEKREEEALERASRRPTRDR